MRNVGEDEPTFSSTDFAACIDDPDVGWAVREITKVERRRKRGEDYLEFWVNGCRTIFYFIFMKKAKRRI